MNARTARTGVATAVCAVATIGALAWLGVADQPNTATAVKTVGAVIVPSQAPYIVPQDVWTIETTEVTGHPLICGEGQTASGDGTHCVDLPPVVTAPPSEDWTHGLPPCVYEDGSGGPIPCYWDATERGNGIGRSYIVWVED